jgi:hypothetical protein
MTTQQQVHISYKQSKNQQELSLKVGFRLRTLSYKQAPSLWGPNGDKAHGSLAEVIGVMCEELGRQANLVYQAPYCI